MTKTIDKVAVAKIIRRSFLNRESGRSLVLRDLKHLQKQGLFSIRKFSKQFGEGTLTRLVNKEARRRRRLIRQAPDVVILNTKKLVKFLGLPRTVV